MKGFNFSLLYNLRCVITLSRIKQVRNRNLQNIGKYTLLFMLKLKNSLKWKNMINQERYKECFILIIKEINNMLYQNNNMHKQ